MGGPRKRMCSPNCVQRSDKAPAAGATGSFLLRSPLEGWGRRGSGAGLGRGRRDIQKAAMRKPKNKTSPLTPTHCSRQSKAARGGEEKKKVVEMPLNVFHKPKKPKSWQHSWICCWKLQLICPTLCYVRESLIYNTKVIFLPAQRHGALTTLV